MFRHITADVRTGLAALGGRNDDHATATDTERYCMDRNGTLCTTFAMLSLAFGALCFFTDRPGALAGVVLAVAFAAGAIVSGRTLTRMRPRTEAKPDPDERPAPTDDESETAPAEAA